MSIALESYYILDEDVIANESFGNVTQMAIGFLVQMVKKLSQIILANWPKILITIASFVVPFAIQHAMAKCADGLINQISEKFVSIGNHVIGVIQDFATGLNDITAARLHLGKMTEDNNTLCEMNKEIIEHSEKWQKTGIRPYVTKDAYNKCNEAYLKTKEILTEANARLQKAIDFDWERKGIDQAKITVVRHFFSDVQGAFSKVLTNTNTAMSNITQVFAKRKR